MHARSGDTERTHRFLNAGFNGQIVVLLWAVVDPDEKRESLAGSREGDVIALPGTCVDFGGSGEMLLDEHLNLLREEGVVVLTDGPVKGRWAIAFPVVDAGAEGEINARGGHTSSGWLRDASTAGSTDLMERFLQ